MKKFIIIFILILSTTYSIGFNDRLTYPGEKVYFSMILSNKQIVTISGEKGYLVYRYGNKDKIKMEFPKANINSWKVFSMNYYNLDSGDNYYLNFHSNQFEYRIYEESYEDKLNIGIIIKDLSNGKSYEFVGNKPSLIGSLKNIYKLKKMKKGEL